MDNRFDGLTSGLQQQRSNPPLLGNHAARLEQFGMRFDDLNRIRVLGVYRVSSVYDVTIVAINFYLKHVVILFLYLFNYR